MRIGVISDVHGNAYALDRVLEQLQPRCDRIIGLGDFFGYFSGHAGVYERVRTSGIETILGNHEAMILKLIPTPGDRERVYRHDLVRRDLGMAGVRAATTGTPFLDLQDAGRRVLFVHGTPWDPLNGYLYPDGDLSPLSGIAADVIIMGHTHYPFSRTLAGQLVGNPGSVGLARDAGHLASFGVLDLDRFRFDVYRTIVDTEAILDLYPDLDPAVRAVVTGRRQLNPFGLTVSEQRT